MSSWQDLKREELARHPANSTLAHKSLSTARSGDRDPCCAGVMSQCWTTEWF